MIRKKLFSVLLCCSLFLLICPVAHAAGTVTGTEAVAAAQTLVGKYPYVYGGKSPSNGGFDCTGLIYYVYHNLLGCDVTYNQIFSRSVPGTKITGKSSLLPGDIVFGLTGPNRWHTGLYCGNNTMIHSGSNGASRTSINGTWFAFQFATRPSFTKTAPSSTNTATSSLPTNLSVSTDKNSYTLGESVAITPSANNATHYAISVWLGAFNTGERLYVNYNLPGGITFNPTKPGTYTIRADAKNGAGYISTEKTFTVTEAQVTPNTSIPTDPCANGHNWDNGKVTTEPSVMTEGTKIYTCKTCYTKKTETIPQYDNIHIRVYEDGSQTIIIDRTGQLTLRVNEETPWTTVLINFRRDDFVLKDYQNFITSVVVEEGILHLNYASIGNFPNVTDISLPNSLTHLQTNVFQNCASLKTIKIPANVSFIGANIFSGCTALTDIYVASGNMNYTSVDGVLFSKDMKSLYAFPNGRSGDYTIPNGVTYIGQYAFKGAGSLNSVTIPASVTQIAISTEFSGEFHGTLYVSSGSYAEEYARENGLNYQII